MSRSAGAALAGLLCIATAAAAQLPGMGRQGRGGLGPQDRSPPDRRGSFTFCRLAYVSATREAGGQGWWTDYPLSDGNFMTRLSQLTSTTITHRPDGEPGYAVVTATDPQLFECPFLFASDVGTADFDADEVARLRDWLLKGGFLWVDDFWGDRAWARWVSQIERVLPGREIVDFTVEHPLFSAVYHVREIPQIPSIQFWRRNGGATSERGYESAQPHVRAILDDRGRIMVLMSHNTDIADGWEREGEDDDFFASFSPRAYAIGINVAIWAMTR